VVRGEAADFARWTETMKITTPRFIEAQPDAFEANTGGWVF
jgi:hypothetical protein